MLEKKLVQMILLLRFLLFLRIVIERLRVPYMLTILSEFPMPHTEKSFLNLVNPTQILIVITFFRLIWEFHLVPNLSEKGNHNPNLGWINKVQKKIFCVHCVCENVCFYFIYFNIWLKGFLINCEFMYLVINITVLTILPV